MMVPGKRKEKTDEIRRIKLFFFFFVKVGSQTQGKKQDAVAVKERKEFPPTEALGGRGVHNILLLLLLLL